MTTNNYVWEKDLSLNDLVLNQKEEIERLNQYIDFYKDLTERQNKDLERLNNIINELEKELNYDINKAQEYMNKFIGEEQRNYTVHYYRAEWQKEKATIYLDKLQELKGSDKE